MFQVEKRDGTIAEFQMKKITDAIGKAFGAKDMQFSDDMLQMLALRVTADFQSKIKDGKISVEAIQDSVENVLIQCGYAEVAKAYILYRKQREKIRNMKSTIVDYKEIVDSYVKVEDWRVKENSTVTYSVGGLILSNSGAITANYWLSEIYDDEIAEAHRNADIHIHDLSMLTGYCAGWSLKQLIKEGLGGIVDIQVKGVAQRLTDRRITLDVTDSAREWLANTGYDPAYGARPLRRLVQTEVGDQLARMLLAGKVHDGDTVLVDQTGGEHLELSAWASDQIASDYPDVSVDNVSEDK